VRSARCLALLAVLLGPGLAGAEAGPPSLLWSRETYPWIHVIQLVIPSQSGGFIASTIPSTVHKPIIRFDAEGNFLWEAGDCGVGFAYWLEELEDGSIVATGYGCPPDSSSWGLWISKVTSAGSPLWCRVYEISGSIAEKGLCIETLPDGGFAICGQRSDYNSWLLRTDSEGDTLWTRTWDSGQFDRGGRVIYVDDGLTVYVQGMGDFGPWLLRYSMDGDLLWAHQYSADVLLDYLGGSLCLAPDGGYAMATAAFSDLVHIDWAGEEEWRREIPGSSWSIGYSLSPTMDGGYIFSGMGGFWWSPESIDMHSAPSDTGSTWDGWLVKLDAEGSTQWTIYHSLGNRSNYFNSVRQLQGGGYIVGGQIWDNTTSSWNGYLLRYAPEVGIEGEDPSGGPLALQASCNPFMSSVTITCEGDALPGQLMVYDITGRLIRSLSDLQGSSFLWDGRDGAGTEVPTGTYLIQGAIDGQVSSLRVVRL